jgi:hypothetical protein
VKTLIVHDDFYRDADKVRAVALQSEYSDVRNLNYPGFQSVKCFSSERLIEKFSELIGEKIDSRPDELTFGRFRVMLATSNSRLKVHVDEGVGWSGLIYLNPDHQCSGGTAFYRHRRTGLYAPPPVTSGSETLANERCALERDSLDQNAWDRVMFVAMKFNRLILFRGSRLFHSHTHGFGNANESGRLTQNFFFDSENI